MTRQVGKHGLTKSLDNGMPWVPTIFIRRKDSVEVNLSRVYIH